MTGAVTTAPARSIYRILYSARAAQLLTARPSEPYCCPTAQGSCVVVVVLQWNSLRRRVSKAGDLKRRYFVLDHHDLRYYRDASQKEYLGHIDLGTVTEIRLSARNDVPPFALDLVRQCVRAAQP